jgi:hypothetical protein
MEWMESATVKREIVAIEKWGRTERMPENGVS